MYIKMRRFGTVYGGWDLPTDISLNKDSVVIGVGVGEDISFELLVNDCFKSKIFLMDATKRAVTHYSEIQKYYNTKEWTFSGNIQPDYRTMIEGLNVDFTCFTYIDKCLWNEETELKFYKQENANYVSQTFIQNMYGNEFDIVPTTTISNLLKEHNISDIDVLKLDIEGSELAVIDDMLDHNIYPKYLLVEFDMKLKNKDVNNNTERIIQRLLTHNYKIIANNNYNMTFTVC